MLPLAGQQNSFTQQSVHFPCSCSYLVNNVNTSIPAVLLYLPVCKLQFQLPSFSQQSVHFPSSSSHLVNSRCAGTDCWILRLSLLPPVITGTGFI